MTTVSAHYANHLAPIYLWMVGGADAAFALAEAELAALNLPAATGDSILDLGAGFGMHAIPLARRGALVTAIDSSEILLAVLNSLQQKSEVSEKIRTFQDDLLNFPAQISEPPAAILCMGDTLTHLVSVAAVHSLFTSAYAALAPAGQLILTFRDYTQALEGNARFIPVKSDESRIHICFLEYSTETVQVHDILNERTNDGWQTNISSYPKLRLSPDALLADLTTLGFTARRESGLRGMVRIVATK
jgi:SAM-dependent methyltransferase